MAHTKMNGPPLSNWESSMYHILCGIQLCWYALVAFLYILPVVLILDLESFSELSKFGHFKRYWIMWPEVDLRCLKNALFLIGFHPIVLIAINPHSQVTLFIGSCLFLRVNPPPISFPHFPLEMPILWIAQSGRVLMTWSRLFVSLPKWRFRRSSQPSPIGYGWGRSVCPIAGLHHKHLKASKNIGWNQNNKHNDHIF